MLVALVLAALALTISLLNRGIFNPVSITLILLALSSGLAALQLLNLRDFDPMALKIIVASGVSVFAGALPTLAAGASRERRMVAADGQGDLIRYGRWNLALALCAGIILVTRWTQVQILLAGVRSQTFGTHILGMVEMTVWSWRSGLGGRLSREG